MDLFWKTTGTVLLAAVLGTVLQRQQRDIGLLLSVTVCAMAAGAALTLLQPVMEFLGELEQTGQLRSDLLRILLKAMGMGMTAELAGAVCADTGSASLAKLLRMLGSAGILCVSMPMFRALLECIRQIMGSA